MEVCEPSFLSETFSIHLFYTDDVVVHVQEGQGDVLCRRFARQMPDSCFKRLVRLCVNCKEEDFFYILYGVVVHHTFSCDLGSVCSLPEELTAHDTF
jgi:hypothetical protein